MVEYSQNLNNWIEISESNYAHNISFFQKLIEDNVELSVMIKSNAYGHGWQLIASLASKCKINTFCVYSLDEALNLLNAGFRQDILIMGHVPLSRLEEAVRTDCHLALFNKESLIKLIDITQRLKKPVIVHLKLETGFHRQGVTENDLQWFISKLKRTPLVVLDAAYTHLASVDDTNNYDYAYYQKNRFEQMINTIINEGFPKLKKHIANSAATILLNETRYDMVRLGISQFGLWPSRETFISYKNHFLGNKGDLFPVMTWKTRIAQIKWVQPGHYIGYDCTYRTTRGSRIAVLPVGYAEGYDRGLSNNGYVLIKGKKAFVCGQICMNLTMVDVSDIPDVQLEDEVVLLGKQGDEEISADNLANLLGTINYEVVTRINSEIDRIIV
ncbi:alanine racemase [Candidatus Scalindua japonica]|uniref:Alanine racemase n=1 Tax=Candidatus Scalindua japonica TaxID=1284222 RepID=A0A286TZE0_9BACT|nr:alanine racemase [Candidatus Scalindua japonica]GAX61228.1 alanine racemase [Candidatus Scalindua japonica]